MVVTWNFGDGAIAMGATVTHGFTAPGVYTATVNVLDAVNPAITTSVQVTVVPAVALIGVGPDSDGDGFSDAFEETAGARPHDAASTPTGQIITAGNIGALVIAKAQIKLNFAKAANDSITFSGTLNIQQNFITFGANVLIDVGGVSKKFTLVNNHPVKQGKDTFSLAFKGAKGVVQANPAAKFKVTFGKGSFADGLATTSALTNDNLRQRRGPLCLQ